MRDAFRFKWRFESSNGVYALRSRFVSIELEYRDSNGCRRIVALACRQESDHTHTREFFRCRLPRNAARVMSRGERASEIEKKKKEKVRNRASKMNERATRGSLYKKKKEKKKNNNSPLRNRFRAGALWKKRAAASALRSATRS